MLGDITVGVLGRSLNCRKLTIEYIRKTVRNSQFFEKIECISWIFNRKILAYIATKLYLEPVCFSRQISVQISPHI